MITISQINICWKDLKGVLRESKNKSSSKNKSKNSDSAPSITYKDNYFEELAIEYLKETTKLNNWKRTNDTVPGHDGYVCIYSLDNIELNWWMEAKYSATPNNIYRGRLDSTLIEILLRENIEKLYIITNCYISKKIKNDIIAIIGNHSTCKKVEFITRDILEIWLIEHYDIYSKFFQPYEKKENLVPSSEIFIIQDLEIYSFLTNKILYQLPQTVLDTDTQYWGYFTVYSIYDTVLSLCKNDYFICDQKIQVYGGKITECKIKLATKKLELANSSINLIFSCNIKNKKVRCSTLIQLNIINRNRINVYTNAQQNCLKELKPIFPLKRNGAEVFVIKGESGTGKSFLLDKISYFIPETFIEFECFNNNYFENTLIILKTLLYLYFPFSYSNNLPSSLKNVVGDKKNSSVFLNKLSDLDTKDPQKIYSLFSEISGEQNILPQLGALSRKYVVWDDFTKLDSNLQNFAYTLINTSFCNKDNVTYIISCRNSIEGLSKINNPITTYDMVISSQDINSILNIDIPDDVVLNYFPNLILIIEFKKLLNNMNNKGCISYDTFLVDYSKLVDSLKDDKTNLFSFYTEKLTTEENMILNRIYYSYGGILESDFSKKWDKTKIKTMLFNLLNSQLVCINSENKYISSHDIYTKWYKSKYTFDIGSLDYVPIKNDEEALRNELLSLNEKNIMEYFSKLESMMKNSQFLSIYFILEELEIYEKAIKQEIGLDFFLQLKYYKIYADANVKISGKSAYLQFKHLWECLVNLKTTQNNYILKLSTLYEFSNAAYDNMFFSQCLELKEVCTKLIKELTTLGYNLKTDENINFYKNEIDYMEILSKSELNLPTKLRKNLCNEGEYRYLRSRCTSSRGRRKFLDYANKLLNSDKLQCNIKEKLKTDFDIYYINLVQNSIDKTNWYNKLLSKCQKFIGINKNYHLKALCSLYSLLLAQGLVLKDDQILNLFPLSNSPNPRMRGFYHEILAFNALIKNEFDKAKEQLILQQQEFGEINSYSFIVAHNIIVLQSQPTKIEIKFCLNRDNLNDSIFYLDFRCFY